MFKLIKELPDDIKEIALKRAAAYSSLHTEAENLERLVNMSFAFIGTPEGADIWWEVTNGKYESFYEFHNIEQTTLEW